MTTDITITKQSQKNSWKTKGKATFWSWLVLCKTKLSWELWEGWWTNVSNLSPQGVWGERKMEKSCF